MISIISKPKFTNQGKLYEKFLQYKNTNKRPGNTFKDRVTISLIIELLPSDKVLEEFIFSHRKYKTLIKHDALSRLIEIDNQNLLEKVVLTSSNSEIVRTAINHIKNQRILQKIAYGENTLIPESQRKKIQKMALYRITNQIFFQETILQLKTSQQLFSYFKRIKNKSSYRKISEFHRRLIPIIIDKYPNKEVTLEFKNKKYPQKIRNLVKS